MAVYYTSPQNFKIAFPYPSAYQLWGPLSNFYRLVHWNSVRAFQPQKVYFCVASFGLYINLSAIVYPFKSLTNLSGQYSITILFSIPCQVSNFKLNLPQTFLTKFNNKQFKLKREVISRARQPHISHAQALNSNHLWA